MPSNKKLMGTRPTPEQREALERVAKANHVSLSVVLQWAIDKYLTEAPSQPGAQILREYSEAS